MNFTEEQLERPLSCYKPYEVSRLRFIDQISAQYMHTELVQMDEFVASILSNMTLRQYLEARGGLVSHGKIIRSALARANVSIHGRILEFGAGTCKLGAHLSQLPQVEEIYCMDFSRDLLLEIAPRVISLYGGDLNKITFLRGNMNETAQFPDGLDMIVCYGAVHHLLIGEHFFSSLRDKLKPDGEILCIHEPALSKIPIPSQRMKGQWDKIAQARREGTSENAYSVEHYRRIVGDGFDFNFSVNNRYQGLQRFAFGIAGRYVWDDIFMIDFWGRRR